MDINDIYQTLLKIIRKNQAGGLNATEFGYLWNVEQSSFFDDLLGRFQEHNNSKEGINTGLIQNETILTKLSVFITTANLTPDSAGLVTRPDDFIYRMALRASGNNVTITTHDKWASVNQDVIDPPALACVYALPYGKKYLLNPINAPSVDLDYITYPLDVKWGFINDPTTGQQTYNAATSVQSLWDTSSNREITKRILKVIGVSFQEKDFEQYGQSIITTGA